MKVRIGNQSLRIRISREEAIALNSGETLTTTLQLNAIDSFRVELRTWHLSIGEVTAESQKLVTSIPIIVSQLLLDEPGYLYSIQQPAGPENPLHVEVEIDLQKTS